MKPQTIEQKIYEVRGQKVMLDFDLAELYGVETKVLNQSVKRNLSRFPADFMFQLTAKEWDSMRSQIVTTSLNASQFAIGSSKYRRALRRLTASKAKAPVWELLQFRVLGIIFPTSRFEDYCCCLLFRSEANLQPVTGICQIKFLNGRKSF